MVRYRCSILATVVIELFFICSVTAHQELKHKLGAHTCRLLESKYIDSQPWIEYPIIFQPITRGRLTIWSGLSTLPSSEFDCQVDANDTNSMRLNYDSFAEKLEWTFYDLKRATTYNGVTVNQREDVDFKVSLRPSESYLDCNTVESIDFVEDAERDPTVSLKSSCHQCDQSVLPVINNQIKQLLKLKLNEQIVDNLHWHLTELISNQHTTGPIHYES